MICSNCGAELREGAAFCTNCGTRALSGNEAPASEPARPAPAAGKAQKQARSKKKSPIGAVIAIILAVLVLAAAAVTALTYFGVIDVPAVRTVLERTGTKPSGSSGKTDSDSDDDKPKRPASAGNYLLAGSSMFAYKGYEELYIGDAKGGIVTIDAESTRCRDNNMYDDKAVVLTYEDDALYYYSNGKVEKVAEDVYSYRFCADGSAVAFTTEGDNYYDLHVYSGGKVKDIAKEVDDDTYCISPDGSAVGYIGVMDDKDGDFKGYVWNGSESQELGKNKAAVALSDGGEYVYYFKGNDDNTIYAQKGTDADSKIRLTDNLDSLYLNVDGTEVMVVDRDGQTFVSVKAGEKVKLSSSELYPMLPFYSGCIVWQRGCTVFGVKSFANILYREHGSGKIVSSNGKYETETVVKNADDAQLAEDGKTLFYLKGDCVYKIDAFKQDAEAEVLVEEDVYCFGVCADSKSVLFVNDDGEVFLQKDTDEPMLITDDFDGLEIYKGSVVFYITDDELYSSTGGKTTRITGLTGDVISVDADMFSVTVYTYDDGDYYVYYSSDGETFTEIVRE